MSTHKLYQAVLRDSRPDLGKRIRRVFSDWLYQHGNPARTVDPHLEHEVDGMQVALDAYDTYGRVLVDEGDVQTRLIYAQQHGRMHGWVSVTVESSTETDDRYAPEFMPAYLRTGHITDGQVQLPHSAEALDEDGVHYLLPALEDHRRRVPYVLLAVDSKDPEANRERAETVAALVAGAAVVHWFADLRAQDRFNAAVGKELGVFGGGIRTYLPGLTPHGEPHPFKHRVMGGQTVRDLGGRAPQTLAGHVLGETAHQHPPEDVRHGIRLVTRILKGQEPPEALTKPVRKPPASAYELEQAALRQRLMAAVSKPEQPPAPIPAEPTVIQESAPAPVSISPATIDAAVLTESIVQRLTTNLAESVAARVVAGLQGELGAVLDLAASSAADPAQGSALTGQMKILSTKLTTLGQDLDRAEAERRRADSEREEAESESDRLLSELESMRQEYEFLELELSESVAKERRLADRVRRLERLLAEANQPAYASEPEGVFEPSTLVEALYRAQQTLPGLRIGDTFEAAERLDRAGAGATRVWAAKAWDALLALNEYATSADTFAGGFYDWCQGNHGRRVVPPAMLSMKESASVENRDKFSERRTFPVSAEVDPAGLLYMPAHVKLRRIGSPAPRIHFHDDTRGATGKIWIGYVGGHLPNTRTN